MLQSECPGASEYCELRVAAGLSPRSREAAELGLPHSLFAVSLRLDGQLVGMGRVIGDGGCNFEVVDIAVHPEHQGKGLGTRIMQSIMQWIDENVPPTAYVCLLADDDAPKLYSKFGFVLIAPKTVGMALKRQ